MSFTHKLLQSLRHFVPNAKWRMARSLSVITALAIWQGAVFNASAAAIALWTFETSTPSDASNVAIYPNAIPANAGLGNLGLTNAAGVHDFAQTNWTTPVGNGSDNAFESNGWTTNDYYQFSVPTTGFQDITVSWDQTRSSTSAPGTFEMQYSTTGIGGPFNVGLDDYAVLTNLTDTSPTRTAWNATTMQSVYSFTANLSSLTALDNNANVVFRLVALSSGTQSAAAVRVDNVLVSGVAISEPGSALLAAVALGGLWVGTQRRRAWGR